MPKRFHWGWVKEGTFPIPPDADAFEWAKALKVSCNQKRLYAKADFQNGTVTITKSDRNRKTREIVPGVFDYARRSQADAHYRTAHNRGYETHLNKVGFINRVTIC